MGEKASRKEGSSKGGDGGAFLTDFSVIEGVFQKEQKQYFRKN